MKSKFRYTAYLAFAIGILLSSILIFLLRDILDQQDSAGLFLMRVAPLLFIWVWIFFGEIRTKIVSIDLQDNTVTIKRYLGLGPAETYFLEEISGFKTSTLSSKNGSYEYLYLMIGEKKIGKISAFYHSNYKELKRYVLSINIKNLGVERFSNKQELKDIFS